jgi:ubiquinone/menaquinone biosynthesis C-methylase UbiE
VKILDAAFGHPRGVLGRLGAMIMARMAGKRNAWFISLLDIQRNDHILEVGFGPGTVLQAISDIDTDGFIAGIDASPLMVKQASKRNAAAVGAGRMQLQQGFVQSLPYEDESFDKVVSINSVHIWPDKSVGVKEIRRVLKPGGLIALALQPPQTRDEGKIRQLGVELVELLNATSFQRTRLEFKPFKPIACVCALGIK